MDLFKHIGLTPGITEEVEFTLGSSYEILGLYQASWINLGFIPDTSDEDGKQFFVFEFESV